MAIEKIINLTTNLDDSGVNQLEDSLEGVNKQQSKVAEGTTAMGNNLDKVTGGAVTKLKGFTSALKTVTTGFKSLRVAIVATGIGALILAVVALTQAFKRSEEGQNKWAKIMTIAGNVVDEFLDLLADLGEFLIDVFENPKKALESFAKAFKENVTNRVTGLMELIPKLGESIVLVFKGEWTEAAKVATDATGKVVLGVNSVTDSTQAAINKTQEYIEKLQEEARIAGEIADLRAIADIQDRELLVETAQANRIIADLREKALQRERFTVKERIELLEAASKVEEDITNKRIKVAEERLLAQEKENALGKSNKEALDERAQLEANIIDLETQRLRLQRSLTSQIEALKREGRGEARQERDIGDVVNELEPSTLTASEDPRLILEREVAKQTDAIRDELLMNEQFRNNNEIAMAKFVSDAKKDIALRTLDAVGGLAKEGTDLAKGIAVAQATIAGIQGVQNAYTTAQGSPIAAVFPAYPLIQAGLAAAFSASQIKNILKADSSGSTTSSVASSVDTSAASAASTTQATPSFNVIGTSGVSQIAQSLQQDTNPIQAYVVGSDITTQQSLDRNIVDTATIG